MKLLQQAIDSTQKKILLALALLLILLSSLFFTLYQSLYTPIEVSEDSIQFEVSAGSSFSRVMTELDNAGYLRSTTLFKLLAKWRGVEDDIKAGEYEWQKGISAAQLLTALVKGETKQYRLTLVEGWTFEEALAAIHASEKINQQLQATDTSALLEILSDRYTNPEGLLFPDTYFYTAGTSDIEIIRRAHQKLESVLQEVWEGRLGALPYDNSYQALIMASIIEKESSLAAERGHIAGVFVRRLEQGMRLQSDPTVIYGLGEDYDGNIRRADLQLTTPYNTYRVAGLPPTPIALAGLESIKASVNPLPSDYLYFVASGDGGHYFSSNLEEHNAAVNRYQRAGSQQETSPLKSSQPQ